MEITFIECSTCRFIFKKVTFTWTGKTIAKENLVMLTSWA